eukprot:9110289-Pyramimonas_sp.AAC.1
MGRLIVTMDRDLEELKSAVYERAVLPADNELVEASTRAGKGCNVNSKEMEAAQSKGEGQDWKGRGSPHLHIFMAFMVAAVALAKDKEEGGDLRARVMKALREIQGMPLKTLGFLVR